jgi:hypothetical protein
VSLASPGDTCLVFPGFGDGAFDAPSTFAWYLFATTPVEAETTPPS